MNGDDLNIAKYLHFLCTLIEPRREKMGLQIYANCKASGEPTHPRSLARSFALCLKFL